MKDSVHPAEASVLQAQPSGGKLAGASFTPGPWRELVTRIDDARGYQICHLDLHGKSESERDANRRLIAAAPELLSALSKAADTFADTAQLFRVLGKELAAEANRIAEEYCREVIAKATGEKL